MSEMGQRYETDELVIAAALSNCNGAAWDGRDELKHQVPAEQLNGRKQLIIQVVDSRCEKVDKRLTKPWKDPETGMVHRIGETVKMVRVIFVLEGAYRERVQSAVIDHDFTAEDWRFWVREFYRNGGMLVGLRDMRAQENILRNRMRDRHGITSRFQMTVKDGA